MSLLRWPEPESALYTSEATRSEEHTSELQSRLHLVCRLLLDTATPQIYTLSLHDALPIYEYDAAGRRSCLPPVHPASIVAQLRQRNRGSTACRRGPR